MLLFKGILTFLRLVYRDASLKYESVLKNQMNRMILTLKKFVVKKVKNQLVLNGRTDFMAMIIELLRFPSRT